MNVSKSIDIEHRIFQGQYVPCYIPKINNVPVLDEQSFILKESINDAKTKITNNYPMVKSILDNKVKEIESFMEKNSKFFDWVNINKNNDDTFPEEGLDVMVSDGKHYDVAYYVRSGEYKWLKVNVDLDDANDFTSFVPIKWKIIV